MSKHTASPEATALANDLIRNAIGADFARRLGVHLWDPIKLRGHTARRVVIVREWGRDCDCCESTTYTAYPANRKMLQYVTDQMERDAEGPCSLRVLPLEDLLTMEAPRNSMRDRAMEAYEDGRGANAYFV